jgi:hypothetical protein
MRQLALKVNSRIVVERDEAWRYDVQVTVQASENQSSLGRFFHGSV